MSSKPSSSTSPEPTPAPVPTEMSRNVAKCSADSASRRSETPEIGDNTGPSNVLAKSPPQPPDVAVLHIPSPPPPVTLEPKQIQALEFIYLGLPDYQVAEKIGVNRQTILRWKKTPAFAAALETHAQEVQRAAMSGLKALLPDVVRALQWQLTAQDNDMNYRAAALLLKTIFRQPRSKDEAA